jgi:hypothetical protein
MRSIVFQFRPETTPEKQDAALTTIRGLPAVRSAAPLAAGARNADIRLMGYAYVEDAADIQEIVRSISELPEVESASVPAARRLS